MATNKFSFEEQVRDESSMEELNANVLELKRRLNLGSEQLNASELELMKSFCSNNVRNISYYKVRILKEQDKRKWYSIGTVSLLVLIPLVIFLLTNYGSSRSLRGLQTTSGWITTVLAVTLGLHKFISEWLDARKFLSIFHKAKVDLQNVLYALIEDNAGNAVGNRYDHQPNNVLSNELTQALKDAVKRSREIVDKEAQDYFDLMAAPSFDLAGTLSNASTNATSIFNGFKSKRFKEDMLAKEESENRTEWRSAQKDFVQKNAEIQVIDKKLARLEAEHEALCDLIEKCTDANKLKELRADFDAIDDKIDGLNSEKFLKMSDRDYANFVMDAYNTED